MTGNRATVCLRCDRRRRHEARGLCVSCYSLERQRGNLADWPADRARYGGHGGEPDEAVIERILAGDRSLAATANRAERVEVCRRWHRSGRGMNELRRFSGWKTERYYRIGDGERDEKEAA